MRQARRVVFVVLLLAAGARAASAHELSRSTSRVTVAGAIVRVEFAIGATDLHQGPTVDVNGDGFASVEEVDAAIAPVFAAVKQHFAVAVAGDAPVAVLLDRYGVTGDTLRMELRYTFAAPVQAVTITSTLHALTQADHRHLVRVVVGGVAHDAVLDAARPQTTSTATPVPAVETARRFVGLGLEHIATGYDHLVFLIGLLIAATSLIDVVKLASAFTIGHSITLALATVGLVTLPTALIESLIALSIAWVAVENLLLDSVGRRWPLTLLFGLVHGFGFANVLRDLQLPPGALALSLFTFNAGVELGQLLFVAVAFPVLRWALPARRQPQLSLVGSSIVLTLGVYWFVQRLLLA